MLRLALLFLAVLLAQASTWCPSNCNCSKSTSGDLEISCPGSDERVRLFYRSDVVTRIECLSTAQPADFAGFAEATLGPAPVLYIQNCPAPETSLRNLTEMIGTPAVTSLFFQSLRNLSDTAPDFLHGLTNLTNVRLISNGFTKIPVDFLRDSTNLISLDLRDNFLILPKGFFEFIPNLITLELAHNRLTHLEPGIFNGLRNLSVLSLWSNKFTQLDENVFDNLTTLKTLDLHSNLLEELPTNIFATLKNLTYLDLFNNNFSTLPQELFSTTTNLKILRLYNNFRNLSLPSRFLSNLPQLREVYLMKNGLEVVPENLFENSVSIVNISLKGNFLKEIPEGLFEQQTELEVLDLSNNFLTHLTDGVFKNLRKLKTLNLDKNSLTEISSFGLKGLVGLTNLKLNNNNLEKIHILAFADLKNLQTAEFSRNQLTTESILFHGMSSPFQTCTELKELNLSHNLLTDIAEDWRILLWKLKTLDLSYNNFTVIEISDLNFLATSLSINLSNNRISRIILRNYGVYLSELSRKIPLKINLSANPLICDCYAFELSQYVHSQLPDRILESFQFELEALICDEPRDLRNRLFSELRPIELTCPFTDKCPAKCQCGFRSADKAVIINCSDRGLTEVPDELPMKTIFPSNHTELILNDNFIRQLSNVTPTGYEKVTKLFLSGNQLRFLPAAYLTPRLEVLNIDRNNFTTIDTNTISILNNLSGLQRAMLHGNPLVCNCDTLNIASFLHRRIQKINEPHKILCQDGREIVSLTPGELCPTPLAIYFFCIAAAVIGIVAGILAALYYKYQYEIRVWLYAHRWLLWLVTEEELDKDKKYDAFVSFSQKDEEFVVKELVPRLEASGSKLCVHYRDWIAGEFIPVQIANSVAASRRTLIVLSPNFLESEWGRLEFCAAHKRALSEGRARVVMILYGKLPPLDELDPELRAYISVNTYVKWGDPWFWDKLAYALPHTQVKKSKKDDKLELIISAATPTSASTTPPVLQIPPVIIPKDFHTTSVAC